MRSFLFAVFMFFALVSSASAHDLPGYRNHHPYYHPYYGWSNFSPYYRPHGYYYSPPRRHYYPDRYREYRPRYEFHYDGHRWGYSHSW